jgi:hypothetical protein
MATSSRMILKTTRGLIIFSVTAAVGSLLQLSFYAPGCEWWMGLLTLWEATIMFFSRFHVAATRGDTLRGRTSRSSHLAHFSAAASCVDVGGAGRRWPYPPGSPLTAQSEDVVSSKVTYDNT